MAVIAAGSGGGGSGSGSGDVTGPASSTDNAVPRFDGAGGKTLQGSAVTVDDTGNVALPARLLGKRGADVAAAANPTLGAGNFFVVTGTATIRSINDAGWTPGSVIMLKFQGVCTVTHDDGAATFAPFALAGAANYVSAADGVLVLVLDDGIYWRELARVAF